MARVSNASGDSGSVHLVLAGKFTRRDKSVFPQEYGYKQGTKQRTKTATRNGQNTCNNYRKHQTGLTALASITLDSLGSEETELMELIT